MPLSPAAVTLASAAFRVAQLVMLAGSTPAFVEDVLVVVEPERVRADRDAVRHAVDRARTGQVGVEPGGVDADVLGRCQQTGRRRVRHRRVVQHDHVGGVARLDRVVRLFSRSLVAADVRVTVVPVGAQALTYFAQSELSSFCGYGSQKFTVVSAGPALDDAEVALDDAGVLAAPPVALAAGLPSAAATAAAGGRVEQQAHQATPARALTCRRPAPDVLMLSPCALRRAGAVGTPGVRIANTLSPWFARSRRIERSVLHTETSRKAFRTIEQRLGRASRGSAGYSLATTRRPSGARKEAG